MGAVISSYGSDEYLAAFTNVTAQRITLQEVGE
jgi:hypothetical protein